MLLGERSWSWVSLVRFTLRRNTVNVKKGMFKKRNAYSLETSIKDVCSQEEGGLSSAKKEILQMRTSKLFCKTSDFSKIIVCPHRQEGGEAERTFFGQEGRSKFS